jgi:hypothetical protein
MAAGENLELFGFQFKDYSARDTRFLARRRPQLFPSDAGSWARSRPTRRPVRTCWMVGCSKLAKNISRLPGLPRIEGTVLAHWVAEKVGIHPGLGIDDCSAQIRTAPYRRETSIPFQHRREAERFLARVAREIRALRPPTACR